uniref:Uncharacterized protein n=1 Tax=Strigamia maritima TaxID=126957 RepID=T1JPB1_STRMM
MSFPAVRFQFRRRLMYYERLKLSNLDITFPDNGRRAVAQWASPIHRLNKSNALSALFRTQPTCSRWPSASIGILPTKVSARKPFEQPHRTHTPPKRCTRFAKTYSESQFHDPSENVYTLISSDDDITAAAVAGDQRSAAVESESVSRAGRIARCDVIVLLLCGLVWYECVLFDVTSSEMRAKLSIRHTGHVELLDSHVSIQIT